VLIVQFTYNLLRVRRTQHRSITPQNKQRAPRTVDLAVNMYPDDHVVILSRPSSALIRFLLLDFLEVALPVNGFPLFRHLGVFKRDGPATDGASGWCFPFEGHNTFSHKAMIPEIRGVHWSIWIKLTLPCCAIVTLGRLPPSPLSGPLT